MRTNRDDLTNLTSERGQRWNGIRSTWPQCWAVAIYIGRISLKADPCCCGGCMVASSSRRRPVRTSGFFEVTLNDLVSPACRVSQPGQPSDAYSISDPYRLRIDDTSACRSGGTESTSRVSQFSSANASAIRCAASLELVLAMRHPVRTCVMLIPFL